MFQPMRIVPLFLLFSSVLLSVACTNSSDSQTAIRWSSFPVVLYASPSLLKDAGASDDLHQAMAFWETKTGKTLFDFKGAWTGDTQDVKSLVQGSLANPTNILVNLVYFPSTWPFEAEFAGKTAVNYENNVIQHGLVMLNTNIQFCHEDCSDLSESGFVSGRRAMTHELGHFLGLPHNSDTRNIMYPTIQPGSDLSSQTVDDGLLHVLTD